MIITEKEKIKQMIEGLLYVSHNKYDIVKCLVENDEPISMLKIVMVRSLCFLYDKYLIENEEEINTKDNCEMPPFEEYSYKINFKVQPEIFNHFNKIIKYIVEIKDEANDLGKNVIIFLYFVVKIDNIEIAKLMIEKGADINFKDSEEMAFLNYGADNNVKDINNRTDFHNYAIMFLVNSGADVKSKDKNKRLLFIFYSMRKKYDHIQYLIDNEVDIKSTNNQG
ncbi:ankyrin repeat-containing domain protein [Neocallimastix sp. 'constans']